MSLEKNFTFIIDKSTIATVNIRNKISEGSFD